MSATRTEWQEAGVEDDEDRFSELFRSHYTAVVRFAARRTDPDSARDVAAETFLIAWRRFTEAPDDADRTLPWLYRIAYNVLANEQRGLRRRTRLGVRLRAVTPVAAVDPAGGVVENLHVRAALSRLNPRDQETLALVGWDGLDVASAARVAGCSPRTFAVRLHRARRRLDQVLARVEDAEAARPAGDLELKGRRA
jgi:RNA polymerase sigma factor (sigma-70 family)